MFDTSSDDKSEFGFGEQSGLPSISFLDLGVLEFGVEGFRIGIWVLTYWIRIPSSVFEMVVSKFRPAGSVLRIRRMRIQK